jgi:hypothetical protein
MKVQQEAIGKRQGDKRIWRDKALEHEKGRIDMQPVIIPYSVMRFRLTSAKLVVTFDPVLKSGLD